MNEFSRDNLIECRDHAKKALNEARELCNTANTSISNLINKLVVELSDHLEHIDAKYKQFQMVNDLIANYIAFLNDKVHNDCIGKYNVEYAKLQQVMQEFNEIIDSLDKVKVPEFLIQESSTNDLSLEQGVSLKHFISVDEIELLFGNISIHHENMTKLHEFMDKSFRETAQLPFNKVINKRFQQMFKTHDDLMTFQSMNNDGIQSILKENESLEQELVSLLQMLTNHYDQCMVGLNEFGKSSLHINYDVLAQDSEESVSVLKDLRSIYDIIINNEIRGKKIVKSFETYTDKLMGQIKDLDKIYNKFKSTNLFQIIIFLNKYHEINGKLDLTNYHHIIDQLIYYYRNFLSIYKNKYLVEFHHQQFTYPRQFLTKLNRFLNDELYQFHQNERDRRINWLTKYGEFIPKQFKLPGDKQPSVVQVITEGLNDNDDNEANGVFMEKQLLDLIKSLM
ncbi:autophagy protein 17 [Yamadazyma tenuis]|uniref:Autophagy-related protein 17 n=1 Tax=Candida tenuis (strain ATCC 10573 / BCRC 21748 / CBS 615 / JCM 9827 / NBRC 10315 / NRRL Y-1498 / VKM Y-70) TaxID=590646 RepID=G3B7G4_CANTC|nr:uncharacterized protein CANTEDRAFT_131642 [Yamadazyma tenuis ATCC 10573]EGV62272.1 hypothetical protein CANTEDRAFT_131642 [Yamadazyma tenuis ATCC 10573]WEJ93527.1 autophagy protein 17 [Yamadazyma tenuis]